MSGLQSIDDFITSLMPGNTSVYNAPTKPSAPPAPFVKVPAQYAGAVAQASQHTGIPVPQLAGQFNAENGGNWSPTLRGRADPTDYGITQLNPVAIQTITGKTGGRNYFKDNYGHEFNENDATDQILGSGVYLNYLRQFALPAAGVNSPSNAAVMTAYNTGAQGYAKAQAGDAAAKARATAYQGLLSRNGAGI